MLSMSNFGSNGRLGNQLFQYAFMRTWSERLGVKFAIPSWVGDEFFDLKDAHLRVHRTDPVETTLTQPYADCGFFNALICDGIDISGYFQSERCFDKCLIREVYSIRPKILNEAKQSLGDMNPDVDICFHVRYGDFMDLPVYYRPNTEYYLSAARELTGRRIYLFSDDPVVLRKQFLNGVSAVKQFVIVPGAATQHLAAMTFFSKFVLGPSTFGWWGAWLSKHKKKRVIVPAEGATRPGAPFYASCFWPVDWEKRRGLSPWQTYQYIRFAQTTKTRVRTVCTWVNKLLGS
jgi:hypothetical protein